MINRSFLPSSDLARRVESVVKRRPSAWYEVVGRGYTQALRLIVTFEDGSSCFVKAATSGDTSNWLRTERTAYESLAGSRFLPECHGFDEGESGNLPVLVLEDLRSCLWPPPWTAARIDAVLAALTEVRKSAPRIRFELPPLASQFDDSASWHHVSQEPEPFLSLGLCSAVWLDAALPALIAAEQSAPLSGDDLVHLDVRSDNLCFRDDGSAVLVDWNWACRGDGVMDIAGWLPSLEVEGGPRPESILPDRPECAAILSGYWASRAGLPAPAGAPRVREIQRAQLSSAFPWVVRSLGLPPISSSI